MTRVRVDLKHSIIIFCFQIVDVKGLLKQVTKIYKYRLWANFEAAYKNAFNLNTATVNVEQARACVAYLLSWS